MSKDFNSSNTVSVEVEVEVGDLVAWDWIVIPNGKNYALGQVGIVLNVWETKYTFAVEVAWPARTKLPYLIMLSCLLSANIAMWAPG